MTETVANAEPAQTERRSLGVCSWLVGQTRGRWATPRGRCVQTVLTACLLVTGLSAWAVALVQPWTAQTGEPGLVAVPAFGVDTDRVRWAAEEPTELLGQWRPPTLERLSRNPFQGTPTLEAPPSTDAVAQPEAVKSATADPPTSPREVLALVKTLRLEATLIGENGQRWAVINGRDYTEGDSVAGLQIADIGEGRVRLRLGGTSCLLRMD